MRKIKFHISIGLAGAEQEEIVEFEDDVTGEEIEDSFQDWKSDYIDAGWWDVDQFREV